MTNMMKIVNNTYFYKAKSNDLIIIYAKIFNKLILDSELKRFLSNKMEKIEN